MTPRFLVRAALTRMFGIGRLSPKSRSYAPLPSATALGNERTADDKDIAARRQNEEAAGRRRPRAIAADKAGGASNAAIPRRHKHSRNYFRLCNVVRPSARQEFQDGDRRLPCHDDPDEPDRFPTGAIRLRPAARRRNPLTHPARRRGRRRLRLPPRRRLAMDLCRLRGRGALSQRVRACRAGLPEGPGPSRPRADWVRAAVRDRSGDCALDLYCAWDLGRDQIPANRRPALDASLAPAPANVTPSTRVPMCPRRPCRRYSYFADPERANSKFSFPIGSSCARIRQLFCETVGARHVRGSAKVPFTLNVVPPRRPLQQREAKL